MAGKRRGYELETGTPEEIEASRLTALQQRFIACVVAGMSQMAAYVEAGYDSDTEGQIRIGASKLRHHPVVAAEITRQLSEAAKHAGLTAERNLLDIDRLAWTAEEHHDFHAALRGRELIGKALGQFDGERPAATTQVFVLVAPPQAESPEKWAELVQQQVITPPQPGAA